MTTLDCLDPRYGHILGDCNCDNYCQFKYPSHSVFAAEIQQLVELVDFAGYHDKEKPHQQNNNQPRLRIRRADVAVPDGAANKCQNRMRSKTSKKEGGVGEGGFQFPRKFKKPDTNVRQASLPFR